MMHLARVEADPTCSHQETLEKKGYRSHINECEQCAELVRGLQSEDEDELLGHTIGAYQIQHLVGAGGMGRVYLATHPEIMSRVAIKVFSRDWNANPSLVTRFFAEARATNLIGHENIVNVLDVGRLEDGRPYLVMEHLPGKSLAELVGTEALSDALVARLMLDVLSALAAAHSAEIIHRDLKPDNIFVSPEGRATLLDFGIAKLMPGVSGGTPETATATGLILGTPHYMSPEQATGDTIDARTDIYALGVILYECLTGRRPFQGTSLYRLLDQHVNAPPPFLRRLRPRLSTELELVVMRALSKRPDDRFQSAADMREALAACASSEDLGAFLVADSASAGPSTNASREQTAPTRALGLTQLPSTPTIARNKVGAWRLLIPILVAFSLGLFLYLAVSSSSKKSRSTFTEAKQVQELSVADAAPTPSVFDAMAAFLPLQADAGALSEDAGATPKLETPTRTPSIRTSRRGIAPLSFLEEATRLATADLPDVYLTRIDINGLTMHGRVDTKVHSHHVYFDFLSPKLAQAASKRGSTYSHCMIRVKVTKNLSLTAERLSGACAKMRPIRAPRCSIAHLLKAPRPERDQMGSFAPTSAILRVGPRGSQFWKLPINGINYGLPGCSN